MATLGGDLINESRRGYQLFHIVSCTYFFYEWEIATGLIVMNYACRLYLLIKWLLALFFYFNLKFPIKFVFEFYVTTISMLPLLN